jgi:hypothetical protein
MLMLVESGSSHTIFDLGGVQNNSFVSSAVRGWIPQWLQKDERLLQASSEMNEHRKLIPNTSDSQKWSSLVACGSSRRVEFDFEKAKRGLSPQSPSTTS